MSCSPLNHDLIDVIVTAAQHLAWRSSAEGAIHLTFCQTTPEGEDEWHDVDVNAYDDDAMSAEGDELLRTLYDSMRARYADCDGKTDAEIATEWGYDAGPYAYWLGKVPGTAMNLHPRALGVARKALSWYLYNAIEAPNFKSTRAYALCTWLKERMLDELVHPLDRNALSDYAWHKAMSGELGEGDAAAFLNDLAELSRRVRMIAQPIATNAE